MPSRNKKRAVNIPSNTSTMNKNSDSVKQYEACIHERPSRSLKRERDLLYLDNDSDSDSDNDNNSSSPVDQVPNIQSPQQQKDIESSSSSPSSSTPTQTSPKDDNTANNNQLQKDKVDAEKDKTSTPNDNNDDNNDNNNNDNDKDKDKEQTPPKKKVKVIKPLFKPLETPGPDGKLYEGPIPTLPEILDTLLSHFIPDPYSSEFKSFEGMLVPMEEAWWYYTDFYYEAYNDEENVPKLGFRSFVHKMFDLCPSLADLKDSINNFSDIDDIVSAYSKYKSSIPCAGIIILDSSLKQVLLVKGAWKGAKWGFPKGKLKPSENPLDGALREVKEEIGVEIRTLIDPSFKVTKTCGGKNVTMFLACNVPWSGSYAPKVRNEIACIEWHRVSNIPGNKMSYSNVMPFLTSLEKWIAAESKKRSKKGKSKSNGQSSSPSSSSSRKDSKKRSSPSSSPSHSPGYIYVPPLPNENERLNRNNDVVYNDGYPYNDGYQNSNPYNDGYQNSNPYNDGYQNNNPYDGYQNVQNNTQQYQYYDTNYNEYNSVNDPNSYGMNIQNQQYDIYNQQQQNNPNIPPNNQQQQQYYQDTYQSQPQPPPPAPQDYYYSNPQYTNTNNQPELQSQSQYMNPNQYYPPEYSQNYPNIPQNYPQPIPTMNTQYSQQEQPPPQPPLPPPSPLPPPPPPSFQQEQYQGYQQYNNVPITNTAMAASVSRKLNERRKYAQYNQQQGGRLPSFLL